MATREKMATMAAANIVAYAAGTRQGEFVIANQWSESTSLTNELEGLMWCTFGHFTPIILGERSLCSPTSGVVACLSTARIIAFAAGTLRTASLNFAGRFTRSVAEFVLVR